MTGVQTCALPIYALAYFRDYFGGTIPPRIQLLADRAPLAFAGYALLHRGALRESVLPAKLAELVLCAALCRSMSRIRSAKP